MNKNYKHRHTYGLHLICLVLMSNISFADKKSNSDLTYEVEICKTQKYVSDFDNVFYSEASKENYTKLFEYYNQKRK